ncbi:MAG: GNAT family N-acetyltransferase [Alphaproteobacteria bacterium]|nr:GNAT family N-acetyltransferase [Alphaproteobacteria bacterium]
MDQKYKLRQGIFSDFNQLYLIYMDKAINRFLNFEILDKEKFQPIFLELMASGQLYVYEYEQQIIATCIVIRQPRRAHHVASLSTLATHPNFQGKGIGTQFLQELINTLKNDGIKRIDLCAEADNSIALSFYKKIGFKLEGVLKKYFIRENESQYIDEHIMALILD